MKHLLSEPLLHLLAIGLILFGTYGLLNEDFNEDPNQITITQSLTDRLIFQWATQNGRRPSQEETDGLLASFIQQEICTLRLWHSASSRVMWLSDAGSPKKCNTPLTI